MTEGITELYAGLKTQWDILKDEKKTKQQRTLACGKIIKLSKQANELDPKFEIRDMNATRYADFLPDSYKADLDVKWGDTITMDEVEMKALFQLQRLESIAVDQIKLKLPREPVTSQKFGMIVSAYTEKLVQLYINANN